MNIGFIGIGQMGRHMARHILEVGFSLTVHEIIKRNSNTPDGKGRQVGWV